MISHLHSLQHGSGSREDFENVGALELAQEHSQTARQSFKILNSALINSDDKLIRFVKSAILDELREPGIEYRHVFIIFHLSIFKSE
jgi:hypothetical protein